jgi:hypothetical protein
MSAALNQTLIGDTDNILYGVCEVSDGYGEVVSCNLDETADPKMWENCNGNTKLVLLANERYELELEVEFDTEIGRPGLGDSIAFPDVGVSGQVLKTSTVWQRTDRKRLKISATHWKTIGSSPVVTHLVA